MSVIIDVRNLYLIKPFSVLLAEEKGSHPKKGEVNLFQGRRRVQSMTSHRNHAFIALNINSLCSTLFPPHFSKMQNPKTADDGARGCGVCLLLLIFLQSSDHVKTCS